MKRLRHWLLLLCLLVAGLGGLHHFSAHLPTELQKALLNVAPWLLSEQAKQALAEAANKSGVGEKSPQNKAPTSISPDPNDLSVLPNGLLDSDGSGGSGYDRSVKKAGLWWPVYDKSKTADGSLPTLTNIPLMIHSGPVPQVPLGGAVNYQAGAIGGTAPYHWSLVGAESVPGLTLEPATGMISSPPQSTPLRSAVTLGVTDKAGTYVSAQLSISVAPALVLAITTSELATAQPETIYQLAMEAQGGTPPYRWSASGLPEGIVLAPDGQFSGQTALQGEFTVSVVVTDAWEEVAQKSFVLACTESLRITTERALPSAQPGADWSHQLGVEGGTPPYEWKLAHDVPGIDIDSTTGVLSGKIETETALQISVIVVDAAGNEYSREFLMVVSDLLIAQPGNARAGLAWHPRLIAELGLQPQSFRLQRDGVEIYAGQGISFVDTGLDNTSSPNYTLEVTLLDGTHLPIAEKRVHLLPFSLNRGTDSVADAFADGVLHFSPLTPGGHGANQVPHNVLGPPDGRSTFAPASKPTEVVSLHANDAAGGTITLIFKDNIIALGPGEDLTVFENVMFLNNDPAKRFMEPAIVSVALFPDEWHQLPTDVLPPGDGQAINFRDPFYYARGIAGRNATTGDDPTDPRKSGGDSFDLNPLLDSQGITWVRYVRIQSTGDGVLKDNANQDPIRHPADAAFAPLSGKGASGFDLDAVSAVFT